MVQKLMTISFTSATDFIIKSSKCLNQHFKILFKKCGLERKWEL